MDPRPTSDRAWILIGMMGAGKSAVGRSLAEVTGRKFVDTDQLVQRRVCHSIPNIFRIYGEEAFRSHETAVLKSLRAEPSIVSTGGGIVLREANWEELRRLGPIAYLRSSLPNLLHRLQNSQKKRPLLESEDWETRVETILEARKPLYEQADIILDVDDLEIQEAARELATRFAAWTS